MLHEKLDIKLIRQVRDNPVLYDFNNDKYMDYNAKEVAWQKIGDELQVSASDCKIRWIKIRDAHRKTLRNNLMTNTCKVYKYEKELSFVRQYYKDFDTLPIINCEAEDKTDNCNGAHDTNSDDSEKPIKRIKEKRRKCINRKEKTDQEEQKQFTSTTTFNNIQFDIADPVDAFLLSIGATLKTFSPYHLNIAKSKIFDVVQEHNLQQIFRKGRDEQGT